MDEMICNLQKRWLENIHRASFYKELCHTPLHLQVFLFFPFRDRSLRNLPAREAAAKLFNNVFKHLATKKELKLAQEEMRFMWESFGSID